MKPLNWLLLAGSLLFAAFVMQSPYLAFSIYIFLTLAVLAWGSAFLWLARVDCERSISETTVRQGDTVRVHVKVTNPHPWPIPWIFIEDYHPTDFPRMGDNKRLLSLMPGQSASLDYTLTCPRRGYHPIGPLMMESGDLFGLQKRFRSGKRRDYLSVLPTVAYIDTFNVASRRPQGPVRFSNRIYEDPTRIHNIREYVPGDPMKNVHWKATARTGRLHVKTHEPSTVMGGTLLLDLHDESYVPEKKVERMELAITTAASIAYLLQMSGEQVGMVTNARDAAEVARYESDTAHAESRYEMDDLLRAPDEGATRISPLSVRTARSPIQAQQIIENLARVLPSDNLDASALLLASFRGLPRDAALLPVVPQVTERLAWTLASIKMSGFSVTVFFINQHKGYDEACRLLAPHAIPVLHIQHASSLHEISPAAIGQ
ncbi:MAG: DUF58 domain-containing protein [Candidatus Hydrogenedens sp.]|nr:DUF58 domain-containing protein [Candidatus Hydrogenedens sp.]